jgi:hypothetical protein
VLPLAHAGHYAIWVFYALPVVVVVGAIIKSRLSIRHSTDAPPAGGGDQED